MTIDSLFARMKRLLGWLLLFLISHWSLAQTPIQWLQALEQGKTPQEKLWALERLIWHESNQQQYTKANEYAQQALGIAQAAAIKEAEANAYYWLGRIAHEERNFVSAINQLLNAQTVFQESANEPKLYEVISEIGLVYQHWQVYDKSAQYFERAYQLAKKNKQLAEETESLERMATVQVQLKNYPKANEYYTEALSIYQTRGDEQPIKNMREKLASLHLLTNEYSLSLAHTLQLLALGRKQRDTTSIIKALNQAGYIEKQLNNPQKSLVYFQEALSLAQRQSDRKAAWLNAGVIYTHMADYATAKTYYQKALRISEQQRQTAEIAEAHNYLAMNELLAKSPETALDEVQTALATAQKVEAKEVIQESYKILSEIHQKMGNLKEAQSYLNLHKQTLDEMLAAKNRQYQAMMQKQIETEKIEGAYKLLISEKEKQALALKQLQLEAEKQQKDLALSQQKLQILQRDKDLQASSLALAQAEKEKIQQTLLLAQQELNGRQKEQAIAILQKDKELQNIALEKQKLIEADQKNAIRFLEAEKAQQAEQLRQEAQIRFYGIMILLLFVLLLLLAIWVMNQIRKKNKKLAEKNEQIEKQRIEIMSQNEELAIQNEQIESSRREIQRSLDSISILNEVGKQIIASLNLDTVFGRVYENVNNLMDATVFAIGIYDNATQLIHYQTAMSNGVRYVPFTKSANDPNQFAAWCIRNRKDIFINNIDSEYQNYIEAYPQATLRLEDGTDTQPSRSLLYTPLLSQNKCLGLITVQSFHYNAYADRQLDLLRNIAIYTTIALENIEDYKKIERQKRQIEEQNKDIWDSINTALRIQHALLPLSQTLEKAFGKDNFFIFYQPKDIVSGDFYWFSEQKKKKIMIVADCTGHGVPGAMISMIGMQLLDKIVKENMLTEAHKILQILHLELVKIIKQYETQIGEGMDMAIAVIHEPEKEHTKIEYAGAMTPIYWVSRGVLTEMKPDRMAIGGNDRKKRIFTKQVVNVPSQTVLYMLTDGYQDQFGGGERRKFMIRRLREYLTNIAPLPMSEQAEYLQQTIRQWIAAGEELQTDDITLLGFRLS